MIFHDDELDDELKERLFLLAATPSRDPAKAGQGRQAFMNKVREVRSMRAPFLAPNRSKSGFLRTLFGRRPAFAPLALALIVTIGLLFGGGWGTVYAAQGSLPNDFLYPVKLAAENVRLSLTVDPEARVELLTTYTTRRIDEATRLASRGEPIPEELPTLVDEQINEIFTLAATMNEEDMEDVLLGVQRNLRPRDRDQGTTNTMEGTPEDVDPQLVRLTAMLQACQELATHGLGEPNIFQQQFRHQLGKPTLPVTPTLTTTITSTITSTVTITPEVTVTLTITPGHHGPGPCEIPGACTPPAEEHGPFEHKGTPPGPDDPEGYGPGYEQGSGPQYPTATPTPGEIEDPIETPDPTSTKSKSKNNSNYKRKP